MCANYRPVTASDRLLSYFGVVRREGDLPFEFQAEAFPTGFAPFIRRRQDGPDGKEVAGGHFGLLPHFAKELAYGRRTYNARSETVDQLASFKRAWARSQRCVVPVECVFEPNYESGKVVRWRIEQPGQVPIGIAGIWTEHPFMQDEHGQPLLSFSMLTVNADGHVVFGRMHKPGDEKRMPVFLDPAEHDRWLQCTPDEARTFFRQWLGPFDAYPAALPARQSA